MSKFPIGTTLVTPGALAALEENGQSPASFLDRHAQGDCGVVIPEVRQINEDALIHGGRILSVYETFRGKRIWIVTEADRSATTILLPEEH